MTNNTAPSKTLFQHIENIPDPRVIERCDHKLVNIVSIAICAIIAGADDWNMIEEFGKTKRDWFSRFLDLENGIPSHDTFRRFFSLLSPDSFQKFFTSWVKDIAGLVEGVIAIDGKTSRRSHDRRNAKSAIHMVSAWAAQNKLVVGQVKTEEKSNEITAIPELLKVLELSGCIVTIDAMGCQTNITNQITKGGGDYIIAVKGNQKNLHEQIKEIFHIGDICKYNGYDTDTYETVEKSRNRIEVRRHFVIDIASTELDASAWNNINIIGMIESLRTIDGETSIERRYYIGSIEKNAKLFANSVRSHWGVENCLHWQLDMSFREDESRMRKGFSSENFSVMRHIALNLLKNDKSIKLGVKNKRLRAGWDDTYLAKLLMSA